MASRETYNIRNKLKYTKGFKKKTNVILNIIRDGIKRKYVRKLIIKDNISTPFHKLVTCKIKSHYFIKSDEGHYYWCYRCSKVIVAKNYDKYIRSIKIKKLMKKSKRKKL